MRVSYIRIEIRGGLTQLAKGAVIVSLGEIHTPNVLYDSVGSILFIVSVSLVLLPEVMLNSFG